MEYELLTTIRLRIGGVRFECWDADSFAEGVSAAWGRLEKSCWPPAWMSYQRSARPRTTRQIPLSVYDELAGRWWGVTTGREQRPVTVCGPEDDFETTWEMVVRHVADRERLHVSLVRATGGPDA